MTLLSRRNHRITQSSILRRITEAAKRFALPAGSALLLTVAPAVSADAPRGVKAGQVTVPRRSSTSQFLQQNRASGQTIRQTAAVAQDSIRIPLPPIASEPTTPKTAMRPDAGTWQSSTPATPREALPPIDVTQDEPDLESATQMASPPATASSVGTPMTGTPMSGPGSWDHQEYQQRLSAVLSGREYIPARQRLADYWHEAAVRFQHNNRKVVSDTAHTVRKHRPKINVVTYDYEESDVYNERSIVAALGPVRTAGAIADESTAETSERLTRDMTTISPTLTYALRGIDESQLPAEYFQRMDNGEYVERESSPTVLQWAPTNLWYHPLYFEDVGLERYGHTYHPVIQPFASTGKFAAQLVGLPYQMALKPVCSKNYALGYYRPGEYAPKLHYQVPFNTEAALIQAGALTGFLLIFP